MNRFFYLLSAALILCLATPRGYAQSSPPLKSRLPQASLAPSAGISIRSVRYSPKEAKVSPELWGLYQEHAPRASRRAWQSYTQQQQYDETLLLREEKVMIEAVAEQSTAALQAQLESRGLEQTSVFGRVVSGWFPLARVATLEDIDELRFVSPGYRPVAQVGSVTSQGDAAQGSDVARNTCGLGGAGVTVGILGNSYNGLAGAAAGIASGDLPGPGNPEGNLAPVAVLADLAFSDEGRAMAEIIHDVAPQAALAFHTAFAGQVDYANGILELAEEANADVMVDDVVYLEEPFFQDGIVAQAVDQVKEAGVTYLSSAGNRARRSYESEFRATSDTVTLNDVDGNPIGDYVLHDFNPGTGVDNFQRVTFSSFTDISFQWSQPFASICPTSPGAATDLDIFIFSQEGDLGATPVVQSIRANVGANPLERLSIDADADTEAHIVIGKLVKAPQESAVRTSPDPERIKYLYVGRDVDEEYATNSGTAFGHSTAAGAIAVGAVPYFGTPAFGVALPVLEPFSSAGGTPILLTPCGDPITPVVRRKPEVCGPDGANTTFFGTDRTGDEDKFPNFFGTSAAAPHVAGLVALMREAVPDIGPDSVEAVLQRTALDMNDPFTSEADPGFDFGTGFGLVRADVALSQLTSCTGVARLELYDTDADTLLQVLREGDRILAPASSARLAVRAVTQPAQVGSVVIRIDGSVSSRQIENQPPYTSFGDRRSDESGPADYVGRAFAAGGPAGETYTVEALAHSQPRAQGDTLGTLRVSFSLVDTSVALPAEAAPTLAVYPNPVDQQSHRLRVQLPPATTAAPLTLRLLNQRGEELLRRPVHSSPTGGTYSLDLGPLRLPPGLYLLRTESPRAAPQIVRIVQE